MKNNHVGLNMNKKISGFTLAEVLVTLIIIGVVAALTIPQLMQSSKNAGNVTRLKKTYGSFQNAFKLLAAEGTDMDTLFAGNQSSLPMHPFAAKMNTVRSCDATAGCFPNVIYKYLTGVDWYNINNDSGWGTFLLADGTSVLIFDYPDAGCISDAGTGPLHNVCGEIYVDTNGGSPPNVVGKDLFLLWITRTGIFPFGSYNDWAVGLCGSGTNGWGCSTKVLKEGEINY